MGRNNDFTGFTIKAVSQRMEKISTDIAVLTKKGCRAVQHRKPMGLATLMMIIAMTTMAFTPAKSVEDTSQESLDKIIVNIIKDIDLSRNANDILTHYNLKQSDFENNSWTDLSEVYILKLENSPEEYVHVNTSLKNVWVNDKFNGNATPSQEYIIQILLGYSDEAPLMYEALYKRLEAELPKGKKVDFEYNGKDILCYYDNNGFKITVGKDLEPINYDEMEELGL